VNTTVFLCTLMYQLNNSQHNYLNEFSGTSEIPV